MSRSHSLVHTLAHTDQKHYTGEKQEEGIGVKLFSYYEKQYNIFLIYLSLCVRHKC